MTGRPMKLGLHGLVERVLRLMRRSDRYEPALHYMRGPGPRSTAACLNSPLGSDRPMSVRPRKPEP